jgi:NAD(P)-dependent dehydrogenase (short-subunit alcohol dehydrogenase family)
VCLVTGASVGFGRSITEYVLSKGDVVVATMRKPEAVADLTKKYDSSKLLALRLDVTKPEEIAAAFSKAHQTFKKIDVVVNNAGYGAIGEVEGTPLDVARGIFEVNFWGSGNVAREAVKFFREVNNPTGGRLLQITSVAAFDGQPGIAYYSARCVVLCRL